VLSLWPSGRREGTPTLPQSLTHDRIHRHVLEHAAWIRWSSRSSNPNRIISITTSVANPLPRLCLHRVSKG